ncbi:molybdate ABC transporter permease subunit [Thalassotalea sp. LPB0316]|uniref:molybdate ABC transporter permease subunit n=1 Tax=Thalassotalea sp. LPB0316 TaxID=2769490 RepID=UPI001867F506|nr:molybdate ABC transporter permease subunit [Thalassotalea sp. LPB0316]QOL25741.1 molybdate ABC transporter permease subunit [Thalassotalea sp. LPB0316]
MFDHPDITALLLTLELAAITTLILLVVCTPIAWWLAHWQSRAKFLVEAFITLPLILPPTVIGFYLLIAFGPNSAFGQLWQALTGSQLAFSFSAIVIGSLFYSLPFVVQPLQRAFEQLGTDLLEAGAMLNANKWDQFFTIVMPLTKPSFITAATLGFAHTIGEFGIVLMIGGNIPGETRVLSLALFDHVEAFEYQQAHALAMSLLIGCFALLAAVGFINRKKPTHKAGLG